MGSAPAVRTVADTGHGDPRRRRPAALLVALVGTVGSCATIAARSVVARRDRRKTAQDEALAGSERRYRMLFDQAAVGIAVIRLDGELVDANAALCRMLGTPPAASSGPGSRTSPTRPIGDRATTRCGLSWPPRPTTPA